MKKNTDDLYTSVTPPLLVVCVQEPGGPVHVAHDTRSAAPVESRFLSPCKNVHKCFIYVN